MKIRDRKLTGALFIGSLLLLLLIGGVTAVNAQTPSSSPISKNKLQSLFYQANGFYEKGQFEQAVESYQKLLASGYESGNLYYNLGNAYFKLGNKGLAILYYEKARRLIPGDADLKANLAYLNYINTGTATAENTATDWKIELINNLAYLASINQLFTFSSVGFFALIGLIIYLILFPTQVRNSEDKLKGLWFGSLLTVGILFIISVTLTTLTFMEQNQRQAVTLQADVVALFEPKPDATLYYHLSEGNKVRIMEEKGDWLLVKRPDGKRGWVEKKYVESI